MDSLSQVAETIREKNYFVILGHQNPDGDCLGSMVALHNLLKKMKKESIIVLDEELEENYEFLFTENEYFLFDKLNNYTEIDWPEINIIALDAGDRDRLGKSSNLIEDYFLFNIDHHPGNPGYGDINYINSHSSAVGEILYEIVQLLNIEIDKKIGVGIGVAIISDTGSLRYQNTTAHVFRIIANLIDNGVDIYSVNKKLYSSFSYKTIKLRGMALANLEIEFSGRAAWLYVDQDMLTEIEADVEDAANMVDFARDIKGVEVGISFIELTDGRVKVSLRSKEYVPVNKIARNFGGGGHSRAAGCTVEMKMSDIIEGVLKEVKRFVDT